MQLNPCLELSHQREATKDEILLSPALKHSVENIDLQKENQTPGQERITWAYI